MYRYAYPLPDPETKWMTSHGYEVNTDTLFWAEGHPASISDKKHCAYLNQSEKG